MFEYIEAVNEDLNGLMRPHRTIYKPCSYHHGYITPDILFPKYWKEKYGSIHMDSHTIYDILCIASSESYGNRNLFDGAILYRMSPQDAREICKFLSGCRMIPTGTTLKDLYQRYDPYNIHSNFANYGDTGIIKLDTEPEHRDGEVVWYKYWVSSKFTWRKSQTTYYKC